MASDAPADPPAAPAPEPPKVRAPVDVRWLTDLGVTYFRQRQFKEAFQCFRRAAQQGFATAQFCLAVCYFNGHGTGADEAAALAWLRQAAGQHDANAEFTLGLAYQLGRGIAADPEQAGKWLRQAAAHGHREAAKRIRELERQPSPDSKSPVPEPPSASPAKSALEKNMARVNHDLQRAILGLFKKKPHSPGRGGVEGQPSKHDISSGNNPSTDPSSGPPNHPS